jgi:hypothetical protein
MDRDAYVERIFPRLPPARRPASVEIVLPHESKETAYEAKPLSEIAFGCNACVPFTIPPFDATTDLPFVEHLNYKNWGYKDGCTAILMAYGHDAEGFVRFVSDRPTYAIFRGGKEFQNQSLELLFALPGTRSKIPSQGTVRASIGRRSLEFTMPFDPVRRVFRFSDATHPSWFRDEQFYNEYIEFHLFARLSLDGDDGTKALADIARDIGADPPCPSVSSEDVDYEGFGSAIGISNLYENVPFEIFCSRSAVLRPAHWYCILVSDPKLLSTSDAHVGVGWMMNMLSLEHESRDISGVYQPLSMNRRDLTKEILDRLWRDCPLNATVCDAWIERRKDNGMEIIVGHLINDLKAEMSHPARLIAYVNLIALRMEHRTWNGLWASDEADEPMDYETMDETTTFAMLLEFVSSLRSYRITIVNDLIQFMFCSMIYRRLENHSRMSTPSKQSVHRE